MNQETSDSSPFLNWMEFILKFTAYKGWSDKPDEASCALGRSSCSYFSEDSKEKIAERQTRGV